MTDKTLYRAGWFLITGAFLAFVLMGERRFGLWMDRQLNDILPGGTK